MIFNEYFARIRAARELKEAERLAALPDVACQHKAFHYHCVNSLHAGYACPACLSIRERNDARIEEERRNEALAKAIARELHNLKN